MKGNVRIFAYDVNSKIQNSPKVSLESSRRLRQILTECTSHTTKRTGRVLSGSQIDGFSVV